MTRRFRGLVVLAVFVSSPAWGESYSGALDVIHETPGYIQLNPDISIFPGERVTFETNGSCRRKSRTLQNPALQVFWLEVLVRIAFGGPHGRSQEIPGDALPSIARWVV